MEQTDLSADEDARIRRLRNLDKSSLPPDGRPLFNRLIFSGSPYLLQHAENPVDWYPWGDEAFDQARNLDRPIFLSIGYATCHWCHVMAHESFEDREVAEVINRLFVPVKVDREERPDIDEQYMTAAQLMNQSGGWPLNIVMTPEGKPFFAATYLPRSSRQGMRGIIDILEQIAGAWRSRRTEVEQHGAAVIKALRDFSTPQAGSINHANLLEPAYEKLRSIYDPLWGGFGNQPKFPMPLYLLFLLYYLGRTGSPEALKMLAHTLQMMRRGGIYDQLGFGFHRYSVDNKWLIPHFEKMLYDQALMAICYLQAFQITEDVSFRQVAEEIFAYVESEMAAPEGGFYSALDADSQGEEGIYYLWTREGIAGVIGPEHSELFFRLFGMGSEGMLERRNIFWLPLSLTEFAGREGLGPEELDEMIKGWRKLLLSIRTKRIRPLRDEKVLTAWNGLMIAALAGGYGVTGEDKYREMAARSIAYVKEKLTTKIGRLQRVAYQDNSAVPGLLEDYAFFVWGLIEMHQNTLSQEYLADAVRYTIGMLNLFKDSEGKGFYETGADSEPLLVRMRGGTDGVIPSGNSMAIMNLLRLGHITQDRNLLDAGEAALRSCLGNMETQPLSYIALLMAHDFFQGPLAEINLAGQQSPESDIMLAAIRRRFIPGLVLRRVVNDQDYPEINGKPVVYICAQGACHPPITDLSNLERLLHEITPRQGA